MGISCQEVVIIDWVPINKQVYNWAMISTQVGEKFVENTDA
jgi:hypothetical protein